MTPEMTPEADRLDELFDCLGHAQRRRLLAVVATEKTPIPVEDAIEGIAMDGSNAIDGPTVRGSSDDIAIALVHKHLPKLRQAGLVEYDSELGMVQEGDGFERAMQLLKRV